MQIHGLQSAHATQPVQRSNSAQPAQPVEAASAPSPASADQLDLSPEAQALSSNQAVAADTGGIRADKVAAIRQAIADGTYETPEKLSASVDKLLDTFA